MSPKKQTSPTPKRDRKVEFFRNIEIAGDILRKRRETVQALKAGRA